MKSRDSKTRLRFEFELVPLDIEEAIVSKIKDKFEALLMELIKEHQVNMNYPCSMTLIDVTPIQWSL